MPNTKNNFSDPSDKLKGYVPPSKEPLKDFGKDFPVNDKSLLGSKRRATLTRVLEVMQGNPLAQKYRDLAGRIGYFVDGPRDPEIYAKLNAMLRGSEMSSLNASAIQTFSIIPRNFIEEHGHPRLLRMSSEYTISLVSRAIETGLNEENAYDFKVHMSLLEVVAKFLDDGDHDRKNTVERRAPGAAPEYGEPKDKKKKKYVKPMELDGPQMEL